MFVALLIVITRKSAQNETEQKNLKQNDILQKELVHVSFMKLKLYNPILWVLCCCYINSENMEVLPCGLK